MSSQKNKKMPRTNFGVRGYVFICVLLASPGCGSHKNLKPLAVQQSDSTRMVKTFSVEVENYCPVAGSRFSDVFFTNLSLVEKDDLDLPDWDRDGIPDREDNNAEFGFSYKNAKSTGTGYSDLGLWRRGITALEQSRLKECENPDQDTDHDGLSDCDEEVIYRTDPQKFDSDGDGIPDGLEVRFGSNPLDAHDSQLDPDGDGVPNISEIRQNTPLSESNTSFINLSAVHVSTGPRIALPNPDDGCFWLRADNIPTLVVSNGNLVKVHVIELDAENKAVLKVLSILVPSTTPDRGVVKVEFRGGA